MKHKAAFLRIFPLVLFVLSRCSSETAIMEFLSGTTAAPVFLDCKAASSTEIRFQFSRPVRVKSLALNPALEVLSCEEGEELVVTLSRPIGEGVMVFADILVEDEYRNTLNVLTPFRARNDRAPELIINELRTIGKDVTKPEARVEFVEFIALTAGNLGALRLFAADHSITRPVYEFPPAEVAAGDYIVLHLRTPSADCLDETNGDKTLSRGNDATPSAWDFWVNNSSRLLKETNAVYLMDQDDRIIDAVLLNDKAGTAWNENMSAAAGLLAGQGAWFPAGGKNMEPGTYELTPFDAVFAGNTTYSRTICRDSRDLLEGRPENWYTTDKSGASPGSSNSVKRFIPKK